MSQRHPSAAKVVEASAGRVRQGGGLRKPPVTPGHSEGGGHPDSGTGVKPKAGSGESLLNRSKSNPKVRASEAQGVVNREGPSAGPILSMSVAVGAESAARGVSPSRLRRIAESADESPDDSDMVGGKRGVQSSAVEKDGGDRGRVGDWPDRFLWKVLPALGGW